MTAGVWRENRHSEKNGDLPGSPRRHCSAGHCGHIAGSPLSPQALRVQTIAHLASGCVRPIGKRRVPCAAFHFHRSRQVWPTLSRMRMRSYDANFILAVNDWGGRVSVTNSLNNIHPARFLVLSYSIGLTYRSFN